MTIHAEFQENIEFWDETHQDRYLKQHMTNEQRQFLVDNSLSIQEIREGRYDCKLENVVLEWCKNLNEMLGFEYWHVSSFVSCADLTSAIEKNLSGINTFQRR